MSRIVARYEYTTVKGEPRIRKVRREDKRFQMRSATWQDSKGVWHYVDGITDKRLLWSTRALYRLPEVVAALRVDAPIWWCEGEKDADSLAGLGFTATSTWQGASDLYRDQARWFTKFRTRSEVLIVVDNDRPGGWFGWERRQTLVAVGVDVNRLTVLAPPRGLKDVTDVLEAGLPSSALRVVDLARLRACAEAYGAERAARYTQGGNPTPHDKGCASRPDVPRGREVIATSRPLDHPRPKEFT